MVHSDEASTEDFGTPSRPRAERVDQHAYPRVGEASGSIRSATCSLKSEPSTASVGVSSERTIIRATCKLRVDVGAMSSDDRDRFYRLADDNLRAVARVMNTVIRKLWLADGSALDALTEKPSGKVWPINISMTEAYHIARGVAPDLPSRTAASCSKAAHDKWRQVRWDALVRCVLRPPHYTCPPIPVHNQDLRVENDTISLQMRAGTGNRMCLPLVIRDDWQRQVLGNLTTGAWKVGEAKLERDPQRPGRWYFRVAYKRRVEEIVLSGRIAAINRGIRHFLVVATNTGCKPLIYEGADIAEHLRRVSARRRQIQRGYPMSGRKGRGRKKALLAIRSLEESTERWRETRSQTIAREATRWLCANGITVLYIEDFTDIRHNAHERLGREVGQYVQEWPYYQLQQRLIACCEEVGLHVVQVPAEYISQSCPECGHVAEENRDLVKWQLRCVKCGCKQHLDVAAARNVMMRGKRDGGEVKVGAKSLGKNFKDESALATARKRRRKGAKGKGTKEPR